MSKTILSTINNILQTILNKSFNLKNQRRTFIRLIVQASFLFTCIAPTYAQSIGAPSISPTGAFASSTLVTMTTPSGAIYYTEDGSQPSNLSNLYSAAITVNQPTEIKAVAYLAGSPGVYSNVTTAYVDVDANLAPVLQSNLPPLTGLIPVGPAPVLWLKTDFGLQTGSNSPPAVSSWADLSGSGALSSASSEPTLINAINGFAAVNFNGGSQYLTLPSFTSAAFSSGISVFIVTEPLSLNPGSRIFDLASAGNTNNIFMQVTSSGNAQFGVSNGTSPTLATSASALVPNQYQLIEAVLSPGTSTATGTVYINGVPGLANASMNNVPSVARTNDYLAQNSAGNKVNNYHGNVCELIAFGASLTSVQRSVVESFLLQKYQILSGSPATLLLQTPRSPIFSLPTGTLNAPAQVVISAQPGSVTRFTTDGSLPTQNSPVFSGMPITINYTQTLTAISFINNLQSSSSSATYTLNPTLWPAPSPIDITTPSIQLQLPTPSI